MVEEPGSAWHPQGRLVSVHRPTTQGPSMMLYTSYAAHIHAPRVDYNNIRSTYGRSQPIRLDPTLDLVEGRFKRTRTESWEAEAVPEVAAATYEKQETVTRGSIVKHKS